MTSNSTTPYSPQQCPTCGGHDTTGLCLSEALIREGKRAHHVPCVICADPFHTSMPTGEPTNSDSGKVVMPNEHKSNIQGVRERPDVTGAAHPSETRAGEQEGTGDRSPKDYAIEHGGYLADAAEAYLKQRNIYDEKENSSLGADTADNDVLGDHIGALQSCIYEFRKRAKRAVAPDQTGEGSTPQVSALTKRIRKNQEGIDVKEVLENPTAVMFSGGGSTGPDTPTEDILGAGEFAPMAKCSTCRENYVVAEGAVCTACATASVQGETLSDPPYRCRCSHELIRHGVRGGFPFCLDCDCKGFESIAPTLSDRINALPEWARQHIHDIETKCDPAGDIRTIGELRDTVAALAAEIEEWKTKLADMTRVRNGLLGRCTDLRERSEDLAWQLKAAQQECERLTVDKEFYSRTKGEWKVRAAAAETLVGELRTGLEGLINLCRSVQMKFKSADHKKAGLERLERAEELLTRTLKVKSDEA